MLLEVAERMEEKLQKLVDANKVELTKNEWKQYEVM